MTLREMAIAVLTQREDVMSYRDLTDAIWSTFPDHAQHMNSLYELEKKARTEERIRLGMLVKKHPGVFTATKSEGIVLVGLAATEADTDAEIEDDEDQDDNSGNPAVYWYTFPAYRVSNAPFPIKVGHGINPHARISQQVTAMPEKPIVLGTFEHGEARTLERALHCVLTLR